LMLLGRGCQQMLELGHMEIQGEEPALHP